MIGLTQPCLTGFPLDWTGIYCGMAKYTSSIHHHMAHNRRRMHSHKMDARIAELEAQVANLKAQLAAQSRVQAATPSARLNMLLAISAVLLTTHEVESILQVVVREAMALFPGASGALIFLATPDEQIELRAANSGPAPNLRLEPGQGVAGRAFLAPRAMLMVGPELDLAIDELNTDQRAKSERLLQYLPPTCALLAPLRIEGQRLGALILYGGANAHLFHPRDIPFIQALADLVAVAITETYQRERTAALQRALDKTQLLHAEAKARLDAAQAQLLQSAKLAAVGELSASVAHEINNPLYAARNSLYLVEQDLPPRAPQRQFLEVAQNELERIARIITRMRDFYRPARAELEPTAVNTLINETIEFINTHLRHGHVEIVAELEPDLPPLIAHADQIRQVFLNLLLNACDAMPDGGTLRVTTRCIPTPLDDSHDAQIVVQVSDTGTGIAPEHITRIFEPFYTTKPQGTGLGLAISAHIVTQHGGHLIVDSAIGAGSTFTIQLPVVSR